jgi:two-component system sensor histidine kinase RegB
MTGLSLSLRRARGAVFALPLRLGDALGRRLAPDAAALTAENADRWLIGLRWVAILGMLATTLIARRLVPELDVAPVLAVLAALVASNLGWRLAVALRAGRRPLVAAQITVDVIALTVMLWFAGGTSNPFAAFLTFHIVLAGLLCGARVSIAVAGLTLAATVLLAFADPLPLGSAPLGASEVGRIGAIVSLAALSAFIGFFVFVYVQRIAALRAESARNEKLAVLGRLVGTMSHELNTPLATILLASKDLVEVGREVASEEVSRLAQTIADEAERASEVVGLMRGHVRPDQHLEPVDLTTLVRDFATRELDRLGYRGARAFELPTALPAVVLRGAVCQVLSNVLTNAVQALASTPEPRIVVRLRARRGGRVEVSVQDNGPGVSPALLPTVGEPFQTTKADAGGMGLGLYVSSVLAERMGGSLSVENRAGAGARVTLGIRANKVA